MKVVCWKAVSAKWQRIAVQKAQNGAPASDPKQDPKTEVFPD